ncbi:MAG: uracil phosphoribosyltransferase [Rhodospirillaceae bacterium]|nr:uracil phosphoribosyltransferase [Rhodospirillaceae bacterium]
MSVHSNLTIIDHPVIAAHITRLRDKTTPTAEFRGGVRALGRLMAYELLRDAKTRRVTVQTPLEMAYGIRLKTQPAFISIMRAGNGMIDGMLDLWPEAVAGNIGLYRNEETLQPVEYYRSLPPELPERRVILADPMLATGGTAVAAATMLRDAGATNLHFACLFAAPEGTQAFADAHPDIPVTACALDRELNNKGYILPGLGDAGDRQYGTI